jgi:hypothetical protein
LLHPHLGICSCNQSCRGMLQQSVHATATSAAQLNRRREMRVMCCRHPPTATVLQPPHHSSQSLWGQAIAAVKQQPSSNPTPQQPVTTTHAVETCPCCTVWTDKKQHQQDAI